MRNLFNVPEMRHALIFGLLNIIRGLKPGQVEIYSFDAERSVAILRAEFENSLYEIIVFEGLPFTRMKKIAFGRACEEVFDIDLEENPGVLSWDYFDDFSKAEKVLNSAVTHIFKK